MTTFANKFFKGTGTGICLARGLLRGVGIALGFAVAFYASGLILELLNWATNGFLQKMFVTPVPWKRADLLFSGSGDLGLFTMWSWLAFFDVVSFSVIAGTPVGAVYEIALQKQRDAKNRKESGESGKPL